MEREIEESESKLKPRAIEILHHVCDYVILTGEPISSRTLQRSYRLQISPATIRNEMSDLENFGFLMQPHTSSGRIPTEKGYQSYVGGIHEPLLEISLKSELIEKIKNLKETEEVLLRTVEILSHLTHFPAFSFSFFKGERLLEKIQLIKVDDYRILAILVEKEGEIFSHPIPCRFRVNNSDLEKISRLLTETFYGKPLSGITVSSLEKLQSLSGDYSRLSIELIELLQKIGEEKEKDLLVRGDLYCLDIPEFQNIERLKEILNFVQNKRDVGNLFYQTFEQGFLSDPCPRKNGDKEPLRDPIQIRIGSQLSHPNLKEMSFVGARVSHVGGDLHTCLGVLGPMRMNYEKTIGVLKSLSQCLMEIL